MQNATITKRLVDQQIRWKVMDPLLAMWWFGVSLKRLSKKYGWSRATLRRDLEELTALAPNGFSRSDR